MSKLPSNTIWSGRKRTFFGAPWSFTKYILTDDKFVLVRGVLMQREEEIRLYRVIDIALKRNLIQRIFALGTVKLISGDQSSPDLKIKNIRDSRNVKDLISTQVEKQKVARGVTVREEITTNISQMENRRHAERRIDTDKQASKEGMFGILRTVIGVLVLLFSLLQLKAPERGSSYYMLKSVAHYVVLGFGLLLILEGFLEVILSFSKGSKKKTVLQKMHGFFSLIRGIIVLLIAIFLLKVPESGTKYYLLKLIGHYVLLIAGGLMILDGIVTLIVGYTRKDGPNSDKPDPNQTPPKA